MCANTARKPVSILEATVTSKGQITLPSELRKRFGIEKGSRVRFTIPTSGPVAIEPIRFELEDLWELASSGPKPKSRMSFEEMSDAKMRRIW